MEGLSMKTAAKRGKFYFFPLSDIKEFYILSQNERRLFV
jgi:hypothetical protein